MENRLDHLFQEWHQLGGAVLLNESNKIEVFRTSEEVIAESTSYCRSSGRLTWVVLDWLIRNIKNINEERLITDLLPILDDMERSIEHAQQHGDEVVSLVEGSELIYKKLLTHL